MNDEHSIKKIKVCDDHVLLILEDETIQVSDETYFECGLAGLKSLDRKLYDDLKDRERLFKAYKGALRKISVRDRTVKQIRDYLSKKQLEGLEKQKILDRLISMGLLNDENYVKGKISVFENSGMSYRKMKEKLKKDGIDEELIGRYLERDPERELDSAVKSAQKHASSLRNKTAYQMKQSVLAYLQRNGFSYDVSKTAAESLALQGENELELLQKEYARAASRYGRKYEGYELSQRIVSHLLNKGFSYEDIQTLREEEHG